MLSFVSCPQRLHLQGRSWTVVVGSSLMSLPFPHTGQIAHPSFVTIVADLVFGCKAVSSFSGHWLLSYLMFQEQKLLAYSFFLCRPRV